MVNSSTKRPIEHEEHSLTSAQLGSGSLVKGYFWMYGSLTSTSRDTGGLELKKGFKSTEDEKKRGCND